MSRKKTYQEAINMLREHKYVAPNQWETISEELSLSDQVGQLKQFKVKKDLWSGIEIALDVDSIDSQVESQKEVNEDSNLNPLKIFLPLVAMFLASTIIISVYFMKQNQTQNFVYSSEVEFIETSMVVPSQDIGNYELAQKFINSNKFMYSESILNDYNEELQKLDKAIEEIKVAQEQYGLDESMIKLLSKMEREKATLIKSMINRT